MLGGMRWFFLDSRSYKVSSLQDKVNFLKPVERKLLVQILFKINLNLENISLFL